MLVTWGPAWTTIVTAGQHPAEVYPKANSQPHCSLPVLCTLLEWADSERRNFEGLLA